MKRTVELVYFEGCPNVEKARDVLRAAFLHLGVEEEWKEWDLADPASPESVRRFGSPTILVNGADVTGTGARTAAMACRADGAPRLEQILQALKEAVRVALPHPEP